MRKVLPIIVIAAALAAGSYLGLLRARREVLPAVPVLVADFLPAEFGNAIVFQTPEKRFLVADPGPESTADALVSYLRRLGAKSLDVMVTNPIGKHTGAIESLTDGFEIRRIIHGSNTWQAVTTRPRRPVAEVVLKAGDRIRLSPRVKLEALSPPREPEGATERPLVTRISFGRTRFLLASDALLEDEAWMIRSGVDLRSTVLVVARHGRYGSTSLEFLSFVRPEYCVVMVGRGADRPSRTVLERISTENTGAEVYRTDVHGAVQMISDGRTIRIR
ncbi:MAG: ComEC/Rec2 family competence protein [Armatimonadota bacterium]